MTQCTASGVDAQGAWTCEREHRAKGLCQAHYEQQRRDKPLTRPRTYRKRGKVERHDPQDLFCRIPEAHQRCAKCGEVKPLGKFTNDAVAPNGRRSLCRKCEAERGLDRLYGPGAAQYKREQLERQGGRCAICRIDEPGGKRDWHLDHNHNYPKRDPRGWRGVLCNGCNTGIGLLGDSIERLRAAIAYLET